MAGLIYQPTVSPFQTGDSMVAFTNTGAGVPNNAGLPVNLGRMYPLSAVGMGPTSRSGPLTGFRDPDRLRIAGMNDSASAAPRYGVYTAQATPQLLPPPSEFDYTLSPTIFKYAVRFGPGTTGVVTLSTPLELINNARVSWYIDLNARVLQTTLAEPDIRAAHVYIGGNPCPPPRVTIADSVRTYHPSYIYHATATNARYSLTIAAQPDAPPPICAPIWTWRHNGVLLDAGSGFTGFNSATLSKPALLWSDLGSYEVTLDAAGGVGRATATIVTGGCVCDFDDGSGVGQPDGGVTIDDLLFYIDLYANGSPFADIDDGTNTGSYDRGVTIEDLLYFLTRYNYSC